jgi:hypothetical protein
MHLHKSSWASLAWTAIVSENHRLRLRLLLLRFDSSRCSRRTSTSINSRRLCLSKSLLHLLEMMHLVELSGLLRRLLLLRRPGRRPSRLSLR